MAQDKGDKYIVMLKEDADEEDYESAKKHIEGDGGKIITELKVTKGFEVTYKEGSVHTLDKIPKFDSIGSATEEYHTQGS